MTKDKVKLCRCGHRAEEHNNFDACTQCECKRFDQVHAGRPRLPEDKKMARIMLRVRPDQKIRLKGIKGQSRAFRDFIDNELLK